MPSVWGGLRFLLAFLLSFQLAFLPIAYAESRKAPGSFTPSPETITGIAPEYYDPSRQERPEFPPELIEQLRQSFMISAQQSVQSFVEMLTLLQGLYVTVEREVSSVGIDALIAKVSEKTDHTMVSFSPEDRSGKAELKAIKNAMGNEVRFITTVRTKHHYFIFVDKSQFDPEFIEDVAPEALQEEVELRKALSGVIHSIAARMLLNRDRAHLAHARTGDLDVRLKAQVDAELDPLSERYQVVMAELSTDPAARDKNRLLAEKELLEWELIKKQNDRQNVLSKIYETAVINMGDEYRVHGYEVTVVVHNHGQSIDRAQHQSPPSLASLEYWRQYWRAVYEPPHIRTDLLKDPSFFKKFQVLTKGDIAIALLSTSVQVGFSFASAGIGNWMGIPGPDPVLLALNSVMWGLGWGIWVRTMNNFLLKVGTETSRSLKMTGTGVGFGYTQYLLEAIFADRTGISIAEHMRLWATQALKGPIKSGTQEIPKFYNKTGLGAKHIVLNGYDTEIRIETFASQVVQWSLFLPKLAAMFLPYGMGIPVYMLMGPIGKLYHLHQVERYADLVETNQGKASPVAKGYRAQAERLRSDWEELHIIDSTRFLTAVDAVGEKIEYWGTLIEERNRDNKLTRFRVKFHKVVGKGVKVLFGGIPDLVFNRFPGYYLIPLFRGIKTAYSDFSLQKVANLKDELSTQIKRAGARMIYKTALLSEKRRVARRPATIDSLEVKLKPGFSSRSCSKIGRR